MLLKLETAWKRATSILLKTSSFVSHWFGTTWGCHFHSRTKQVFDSKSNETYGRAQACLLLHNVYCLFFWRTSHCTPKPIQSKCGFTFIMLKGIWNGKQDFSFSF